MHSLLVYQMTQHKQREREREINRQTDRNPKRHWIFNGIPHKMWQQHHKTGDDLYSISIVWSVSSCSVILMIWHSLEYRTWYSSSSNQFNMTYKIMVLYLDFMPVQCTASLNRHSLHLLLKPWLKKKQREILNSQSKSVMKLLSGFSICSVPHESWSHKHLLKCLQGRTHTHTHTPLPVMTFYSNRFHQGWEMKQVAMLLL